MKKFLSVLLSIAMLASLAACGEDSKSGDGTEKKNSSVTVTAPTEEKESIPEPLKPEAEAVSTGNTITVDFAEITVTEAAIADNIQQSVKTGNFTIKSGPSSSADKEFVYIRGSIKNTSKATISMPEISGTVEIDGYSYDINDTIIDSKGNTEYELEPLVTYTYTLYAEVPNELAASFTDCALNFGFDDNFARPSTYGKDYTPAYNYTVNISK